MTIPSLTDSLYYVTYSYEEGISNALNIIAVVSIFALISMIVSLIIGIRKKDCIAIFTVNVMVKTIAVFLYQVLADLLLLNLGSIIIGIIFFIVTIVIEGSIYNEVLKYNKNSGLTVSLICNIVTVIISIIIFNNLNYKMTRTLINLLF